MTKLQMIAGGLLGLLFVVFGANYFLNFLPAPPPAPDGPAKAFMGAIYSTGFLGFVKVLEIAGGALTAIPKTRPIGLLLLVPIVVNIIAFHVFLKDGAGMTDPPILLVMVLTAFLIFGERARVGALLRPAE